jgi:hypothetical protein
VSHAACCHGQRHPAITNTPAETTLSIFIER